VAVPAGVNADYTDRLVKRPARGHGPEYFTELSGE
jgi:hypothetical protein